jgi:hypothetical protein
MTTTLHELFEPVADALENALLIAWDGCHKMYLAMDEEQADWFRENYNGTSCTDRTFTGTPKEMLNTLLTWWDESCGLKFINAVTTNHENPNAGYESLISQDDAWNYEKELKVYCDICDEPDCYGECDEPDDEEVA